MILTNFMVWIIFMKIFMLNALFMVDEIFTGELK